MFKKKKEYRKGRGMQKRKRDADTNCSHGRRGSSPWYSSMASMSFLLEGTQK